MRFGYLLFGILLPFAFMKLSLASDGEDWARFRGPNGSGIVESSNLPSEWSNEKNLKWKAALPGKGVSSPIVVGESVLLTCYTGYGENARDPGNPADLVRHLISFDRQSGKERWRASVDSTVDELPYRGFITQHGYASCTPASDGKKVFALFGKTGLFCFDMNGKQIWQASVGTKSDPAKWGNGSSPILFENLVIVNAANLGNHVVAFNKETGEKVWSIEGESFTNSWSTPTIIDTDAGKQLLFMVPGKVIAADPSTGSVLWETESPLNDSTCACIVVDEGKAFLMGSRAGNGIALECGKGSVATIWKAPLRSGIDTPVVLNSRLYWHSSGFFYVANAETGESLYRQRLPLQAEAARFPNVDYASPVVAGDRIIIFMRSGESFVLKTGDTFKVISQNAPFDEDGSAFSSTPAIGGDDMFVRSEKYLYAIGLSD